MVLICPFLEHTEKRQCLFQIDKKNQFPGNLNFLEILRNFQVVDRLIFDSPIFRNGA